jgi:Tfp pilus assembly protein PilF
LIIKIIIIFSVTGAVLYMLKKTAELIKEKVYKLIIKQGKNSAAINKLGFLYLKQKKYDKALKYFEMQAEQNDKDGFNGLGAVYVILKEYDKAEKCFMAALDEKCSRAMNNLGALYYIQKKYEESEKYYKMAVENGYKKSLKTLEKINEQTINTRKK